MGKSGLKYYYSNPVEKQQDPKDLINLDYGDGRSSSVQFSSVSQSCPALCSPMDYSIPGFPVHHQLPALAQTHVH